MSRSTLPCTALLFALLAAPVTAQPPGAGSAAAEPSLSTLESRLLKNLRQVTSGTRRAGEGYFSPDIKSIIFQAVPLDYPFYQIFTQPLAGGTPRLVSTGRGRTTCSAFHPDGKSIIYASSHLDPQLDATEAAERKQQAEDAASGRRRRYEWNFDPHMDIFRADVDGQHIHRLTDAPGYDAEGSYSADGKQIVFCSMRSGDPDLYIMDADGSQVRQLTNQPGYDGGPFFSPNGQWVIYRTDRLKKDFLQVHAISVDGKVDVALTDNNGVNWAPYWHPSAPYIIWAGADHSDPNARPNYDLWLMRFEMKDGRIAAGPIERVTDHSTADVLPVWSPDGKQLMWTSNRGADHSSQLWIADFELPKGN
ncbi:MAG: PD40 domain-containing protein [Planctomycetes bacterium]|nr:PD40 domain-containing protein [Planctomycetota bacterium]